MAGIGARAEAAEALCALGNIPNILESASIPNSDVMEDYDSSSESESEDEMDPLGMVQDDLPLEVDIEETDEYISNVTVLHLLEQERLPKFDCWVKEDVVSCHHPFTPLQPPGPMRQPGPGLVNESDYFSLFLDDNFLEKVVAWTNANASRKKRLWPTKNKSPWRAITLEELKAFYGIRFILELDRRSPYEIVFGQKYPLTVAPKLQEVFPRDRFRQIYRYIHYCNEPSRSDDRLYKLRPFIQQLQNTFQREYTPGQNMSIDEAMVPFKGRLKFKQYAPDKPYKWGIKVFMLAESSTGYNYNFEVYCGAEPVGDSTSIGLSARVVVTLARPLYEQGYVIYTDRFYSSPTLFWYLKLLGIEACGTVMPNRKGFPDILKNLDLMPGAYQWAICKETGILATVWMDRKPIYFLSTTHMPHMANLTITRHDKKGNKVALPAPPTVVAYNNYMGGVDLNGQCTSMDSSRKTLRWYMKIERKMLLWALFNAHILYKAHHPEVRGTFREFSLAVSHQLVGGFSSRQKPGRKPTVEANFGRLEGQHFPVKVMHADRRCIVCQARQRHDSSYRLKKSNIMCESPSCNIFLCVSKDGQNQTCWFKWHSLQEYWH